jgi:hypothetical protein
MNTCPNCSGRMVQLLFSYVCAEACEKKVAEISNNSEFKFEGYLYLTEDDIERMKGIRRYPGDLGLSCTVHYLNAGCSIKGAVQYKVRLNNDAVGRLAVIFYSFEDTKKPCGLVIQSYKDKGASIGYIVGLA